MSKKRRMSFRLEEDEALVVAPVDFWESMQRLFLNCATDETDQKWQNDWRRAADHIEYWLERTRKQLEEIDDGQ